MKTYKMEVLFRSKAETPEDAAFELLRFINLGAHSVGEKSGWVEVSNYEETNPAPSVTICRKDLSE